jgi:hypothetical protein
MAKAHEHRRQRAIARYLAGDPIEPMVLVSYTPYNHIGLLQTKFRYREGHETRRVGP